MYAFGFSANSPETMQSWPDRRRECQYYIAIAHYRLGNYSNARTSIQAVLAAEPENRQAKALLSRIETSVSREGIIGMTLVGGVAAAALGVLFAAFRARSR